MRHGRAAGQLLQPQRAPGLRMCSYRRSGASCDSLTGHRQRQLQPTAAKMARGVERTAGFGKFEEEPRQVKLSSMLTWDGAVSDWEA